MNRSLGMATVALAALACAHAAASAQHDAHHPPASGVAPAQSDGTPSAVPADLTDGEVRRIDVANGKITLRHGEIRNLGMPPMTMVFKLQDAALLDKLNVGDKVRFAAEKGGSGHVITYLIPAP